MSKDIINLDNTNYLAIGDDDTTKLITTACLQRDVVSYLELENRIEEIDNKIKEIDEYIKNLEELRASPISIDDGYDTLLSKEEYQDKKRDVKQFTITCSIILLIVSATFFFRNINIPANLLKHFLITTVFATVPLYSLYKVKHYNDIIKLIDDISKEVWEQTTTQIQESMQERISLSKEKDELESKMKSNYQVKEEVPNITLVKGNCKVKKLTLKRNINHSLSDL